MSPSWLKPKKCLCSPALKACKSESKITHSDAERKRGAGEQEEFSHIRERTTHDCRGGLRRWEGDNPADYR